MLSFLQTEAVLGTQGFMNRSAQRTAANPKFPVKVSLVWGHRKLPL